MNQPDPLKPLLATWRHTPAPAPDFDAAVWARIRAQAVPARSRWFTAALPLAACVTVLLSIAAGTASALAVNRAQSADRQASAYVQSIDPVQMAVDPGHHHAPS